MLCFRAMVRVWVVVRGKEIEVVVAEYRALACKVATPCTKKLILPSRYRLLSCGLCRGKE